MTNNTATLHGFAYGEHLEGPEQRSLGYRLLAPSAPEPWSAEVEALARRLQAAPYPDHWPPTDLFCSVLLAEGRRLVALVRYGLADHTPGHRRSGLEFVGVVGPGALGVGSALGIYHWLKERRAAAADLRSLGDMVRLSDAVTAAPPLPAPADPVPVLPIRLWQGGALLFAATGPGDPDHRLGLLEQEAGSAWQWLPLVGPDFPLATYAQRGPLVAWTPHLAGVALKVDRPADAAERPARRRTSPVTALAFLAVLLLGANLWATLALLRREPPVAQPAPEVASREVTAPVRDTAPEGSREQFAQALHRLLQKQGGASEWDDAQLLARYDRLAAKDANLRVANPEGKAAVGAVSVLARRSASSVEASIREALANRGYDPELVNLVCRRVHERLAGEVKESP
jgi:hypothetical protein